MKEPKTLDYRRLMERVGDAYLCDIAYDAFFEDADQDAMYAMYECMNRRLGESVADEWRLIEHYSDPMSPKDFMQAFDLFYDDVMACMI